MTPFTGKMAGVGHFSFEAHRSLEMERAFVVNHPRRQCVDYASALTATTVNISNGEKSSCREVDVEFGDEGSALAL